MTRRTRTVLSVLLLCGVFVAGFITALASARLGWIPPPPPPGHGGPPDLERAVDGFRAELGLDERQAAEARAALEEAREKTRSLMEQGRPVVVAAVTEARRRIRATLDPAQQQKFDAMVRRMPLDGPPPPGGAHPPGMPPPPGPPPF